MSSMKGLIFLFIDFIVGSCYFLLETVRVTSFCRSEMKFMWLIHWLSVKCEFDTSHSLIKSNGGKAPFVGSGGFRFFSYFIVPEVKLDTRYLHYSFTS
jgi:hypothetical protein